jgi:hypothetical protein
MTLTRFGPPASPILNGKPRQVLASPSRQLTQYSRSTGRALTTNRYGCFSTKTTGPPEISVALFNDFFRF